MANNYSPELSNSVKDWLDNREWRYTFDANRGVYQFSSKLDSTVQRCTVSVYVRNEGISFISRIPINVMEAKKPAVAEFITRINYELVDGNFEMDYADGEIRFRMYIHCGDTIPSADNLEDHIMIPFAVWENYGDAFLSVLFANVEPQIALSQDSK